ncbi:MAG: hydantoinase/oxoprolinase N-terminal domain-containing protein, partial [Eubacteriales bacterium]
MASTIGIDVGGTYTDVVLITDNQIEKSGKVPTKADNLLDTILNAFDTLQLVDKTVLKEITVSTTLVTNAILQ